jgi:hypothetical protein
MASLREVLESGESWIIGLTHLTRVFTTDVGDACVHVFVGSRLDPPQIVSNITLAHSHLQLPTSS